MFYFSKRVPSDLKDLYKVERLTYSLKTKCPETAEKQVRDALHKLELYWNKVRMKWQRKTESIRNGLIEM